MWRISAFQTMTYKSAQNYQREVGSVNRSSWRSHVPQLKVLADLHKRTKLPDLLLVDVVVTSVLPQHAHNAISAE